MISSKNNKISWVFQIIMSVLYVMASSGKVISDPEVILNFDNWGYPAGFYLVIGLIELVCGLLLLHSKSAGYATVVLFAVMIGAIITHVVHEEWLIILKPVLHSVGLGIVFYFRFVKELNNSQDDYLPLNNLS